MKTRFFFLLMVSLLSVGYGRAQDGMFSMGSAQSMAMGGVGVSFAGAHSIWRNQGGLAGLSGPTLIAMGEQPFLLSEIRSVAAGAAFPTASGTFALSVDYFGFDAFNQQQIGLAYGRRLLDEVSIGARFLYLNTRIPDYGQRGHLTFEVSLLAEVLPELTLGAQIHNPLQLEVTENETLPTIFALGLTWQPSEDVLISSEVEKDIDFPARVKIGIQYRLIEAFSLRVGVGANPTSPSFGLAYQFDNGLSLNVASSHHPYLGFTPGFDVTYCFGMDNH